MTKSQQRMAGDPEFQQNIKKAANGPSEQSHKTSAPTLIGADAWDRQVQRETEQKSNSAVQGSTGAKNLADYINVSKSATSNNADFSIDNANKYVNNSREQSSINKENDAGFSDQRREGNVTFANEQMDNNMSRNEGFALGKVNDFINNAKDHREENTELATAFADRTVDKYLQKNKKWQSTNVGALDKQVRRASLIDEARSTNQGNNTFGDLLQSSRQGTPEYKMPSPMQGVKAPDFAGIYKRTKKDIDSYKV